MEEEDDSNSRPQEFGIKVLLLLLLSVEGCNWVAIMIEQWIHHHIWKAKWVGAIT